MTYPTAANIITVHFMLEEVIKNILITNAGRKPEVAATPAPNDLLGEIQHLQNNAIIKRNLREITDDKGEHTWQE